MGGDVHWKVRDLEHERVKKLFPYLFNIEPSNEIPAFCEIDTKQDNINKNEIEA